MRHPLQQRDPELEKLQNAALGWFVLIIKSAFLGFLLWTGADGGYHSRLLCALVAFQILALNLFPKGETRKPIRFLGGFWGLMALVLSFREAMV